LARAVPYGLSFPVAELLIVRDWAARQGMTMQVITDHVLDGAAFEELLLLRHAATCQRLLCLWRRADQVIAQKPDHRPTAFRSLDAALAALTPPPVSKSAPRRYRLQEWLMRLTGR
jgi:hypothetical protein